MNAKTNKKESKTNQADSLKKVMVKPQSSPASRVKPKYLTKEQVTHAVTVINTRLANLKEKQLSALETAVLLGEDLEALKNGLPRGEFYPTAEKECGLKKASVALYIQIFKNKNTPAVKKATSIIEARQNIIDANKKASGEPVEPKEKKAVSFKASKEIKELSPEQASDAIISAIQEILEKFDKETQKTIIDNLAETIPELVAV